MSLNQLNLDGMDRVQVAIQRLQNFEPKHGYHLAFSGGKDSIVVHHLAVRAGVKFHAFYNWTGIDPPELFQFVKEHYPEVELRRPEKSMWTLIEEHQIFPTRLTRYCCEHLKERRNPPGWLITGVRWAESLRRRRRPMVEVGRESHTTHVIFLHPICDWSHDDVWEYIKINGIPYCSLYDEGFVRLGCILCPFCTGKALKHELVRFPKHVEMWRRAAHRLVKTQSRPRFKDGDELFEWWLNREKLRNGEISECQARFV